MRCNLFKTTQAAVLAIAMALTFSCSDDNDDGGGDNPSSSSGGVESLSPCEQGTIIIDTQVWQKCNSNEIPSSGKSNCYENNDSNCEIYGRLYDYEAAQSACPPGFHLPTDEEWTILTNFAGGEEKAGKKLKAKSGWNEGGNGTDEYKFAALPGGYSFDGEFYSSLGKSGYWWSATEVDPQDPYTSAYQRNIAFRNENFFRETLTKYNMLSVRCLQN